jgi:hypothetical protein
MATRVKNCGECGHRWSTEAISDMVGAALLIFYVQVKLLQVCGPLLVAVILQFPLCLHKLQGLVVSVNNHLFA